MKKKGASCSPCSEWVASLSLNPQTTKYYICKQLFVRSQVPTSGDLLLIFGKEWIKSVSQVEHLEWRVTDHNSQALIKAD